MSIELSKIRISENIEPFFWILRPTFGSQVLGRLSVAVYGTESLNIQDFEIFESRMLKSNKARFQFWKPSTTRVLLRGKGIGSLLLDRLITRAKESKFNEITGVVVKKDLDANPQLLSWYSKRGFKVSQLDKTAFGDYGIVLKLNSRA